MRIRKRQVPLPLSSLSPIPLSDLQVQLQPRTPPTPDKNPASLTGGPNRHPIADQSTNETAALDRAKLLVESEAEQLGDDSSRSTMGGSVITGSGLNSSSSHKVGGSYYDGERAFPVKKRKGSFEMEETDQKKKKMRPLKTKVKKKCNGEEDEDYGETILKKESGNAKRKGNRGNVLMEGSRCSRVNGRGWRCCQPTLVGYSLCEHHLGKGRLRSVMNVKTRVPKTDLPSSSSQAAKLEPIDEAEDDDGSDEEKVALLIGGAKKMMKIGVVKARSMSSLLSQVDHKNGGASAAEAASDGSSG